MITTFLAALFVFESLIPAPKGPVEIRKPELFSDAQLIQGIQTEAHLLKLELDKTTVEKDNLVKELTTTQKALIESQNEVVLHDKRLKDFELWGNEQARRADESETKYGILSGKYYKLKIAVCSLAALIVGAVCFQFLKFTGPMAIYVPIGAGVAIFGALWMFL